VAILHENNTENGVLCDAEHTFHQGILNFQNFVWSYSTHLNVIKFMPFMPLKKIHSSWHQFLQSYLPICTV
jgi:hypothetical protein